MQSTPHSRRFFIIGALLLVAIIILIISMAHHSNRAQSDVMVASSDTVSTETVASDAASLVTIPSFLRRSFPHTDFSTADSALENALSGGPVKDGIPAIDNPAFIPLGDYDRAGSIEAIVLNDSGVRKVYPYNILNWHEIVNDTIDGTPVAITFCPLCGSAIVFDRTLPSGEITTFGVSGGLLESNMIMYDRATEGLWQQSTGQNLAGDFVGSKLTLEEFQLMTLAEVRERFPDAVVLSEDTGHRRDYGSNPYSGYADDRSFVFSPSNLDESFHPKEIMVVFRVEDTPVATPWLTFTDDTVKEVTVADTTLTLQKIDGELAIVTNEGERIPFYFEMWFSFAVQHGDTAVVIE